VRVSTAPSFTNAVNDNSKMVNLEWTVNESTAGGNNLTTTFGWTASSEAASFDRSAGVFHGNHNGTRYVVRASNASTGSDPYFSLSTVAQPYTGNLSSQKFVVGNIAGILPCLQTSAAGNWNSSSNWLNGIVPPASSNVCIAHAMTISSAVDNPAGLTFETGGSLSISNGNTLSLESPGTITNSSGSFLNMSSGSIAFSGLGIVNGAHAIGFNNLELNGNTTLTRAVFSSVPLVRITAHPLPSNTIRADLITVAMNGMHHPVPVSRPMCRFLEIQPWIFPAVQQESVPLPEELPSTQAPA
jgi:hypothetical protein